jgi:phospholipid/cholesterol/gamma-HCH transport system permease protein
VVKLLGQMRRLGVASVPIALFIAVFTGIVLALLASYIFTGTVPLYFVGALVGKTIMMELGPVLTGMALAGRVGANVAAELGTMKVTEQVDALETLGYNPRAYLVVPRVLAATLMFPVVTAFAMAIGVTPAGSPRSTSSTSARRSSPRDSGSSTSSRTSGSGS